MKKMLVVGIVLLAVSIACGPEAPFDEDDEIVMHGVYNDDSGGALAERWVGFWINSPESFLTNFLGLDPAENDRTDTEGEYSETFMGGELMNQNKATYKVMVMNYDPGWPDTTPRAACDFFPLAHDIEVPTLKLWRGNPAVDLGVTDAVFSWAKLSDTHEGEPDNYEFQVKATQDGPGYTLWQEDLETDTSFSIPAYALPEAYVRKWRVVARIAPPSQSDFGYFYLTDPDTTEIPDDPYHLLSLGKNCYAEAYSETFPHATDGKWGPWPTYCVVFPATNVSWVYVDLGDTTNTVSAVVMYGMTISGSPSPSTPGYEVYVASDTTSWGTAVASNSEHKNYFYIDGFSQQGRYVKLQAKDAGIGITGFREICIFGE